jgi:hypothetical protein
MSTSFLSFEPFFFGSSPLRSATLAATAPPAAVPASAVLASLRPALARSPSSLAFVEA